ncbi:MAG: hypothetical protein ACE15B_24625 [Bryobacteraceae bacterium]
MRPFGPGWRRIRVEAGVSAAEAKAWARTDNIPLALLGWVAGVAVIWSSLFGVGNLLYGRFAYFAALLAVFLLSGAALLWVIRKVWK